MVVCGRLRWFVVVCGGLWSFAMVCGGLSYSHTESEAEGLGAIKCRPLWPIGPFHVTCVTVWTLFSVNN